MKKIIKTQKQAMIIGGVAFNRLPPKNDPNGTCTWRRHKSK